MFSVFTSAPEADVIDEANVSVPPVPTPSPAPGIGASVPFDVKRGRNDDNRAGSSDANPIFIDGYSDDEYDEDDGDDSLVRPKKKLKKLLTPKARKLWNDGYVVVPHEMAPNTEEWIQSVIGDFVCFQDDATTFAMGGFSGLGTPDSFHLTQIRVLRHDVHTQVIGPLIKEFAQGRNIECLVDRLMIREPEKRPSAESQHRDESPNALPNDSIFGGWQNLDPEGTKNQTFSCLPGSHRVTEGNFGGGFNTNFTEAEKAEFKANKVLVQVPPGYVLIFFQNIVHEVVARVQRGGNQVRLFTGARLTYADTPLIPTIFDDVEQQRPIQLKSGQEPPMFAKLHWVNWMGKLQAFTIANLDPALHQSVERYNKRTGETLIYTVPKFTGGNRDRKCPSLAELGLPMCRPYLDEDLEILNPLPFNHEFFM